MQSTRFTGIVTARVLIHPGMHDAAKKEYQVEHHQPCYEIVHVSPLPPIGKGYGYYAGKLHASQDHYM